MKYIVCVPQLDYDWVEAIDCYVTDDEEWVKECKDLYFDTIFVHEIDKLPSLPKIETVYSIRAHILDGRVNWTTWGNRRLNPTQEMLQNKIYTNQSNLIVAMGADLDQIRKLVQTELDKRDENIISYGKE